MGEDEFQKASRKLRGEYIKHKKLETQLKEARLRQQIGREKKELFMARHPHIISAGHKLGRFGHSAGKSLAKQMLKHSKPYKVKGKRKRRAKGKTMIIRF